MQSAKYLCCIVILFASCRATKQTLSLPADVNHLPMAYAVSPKVLPYKSGTTQPIPEATGTMEVADETPEQTMIATTNTVANTTTKKATSFAQLKEMAASGEVKMSKKEVKILNKLEKKYKGNFEQFRADTFEFTTIAKVVAGVGIIGLLLGIFTGSGFGWFLFILAALGFLLRFLGIIEF